MSCCVCVLLCDLQCDYGTARCEYAIKSTPASTVTPSCILTMFDDVCRFMQSDDVCSSRKLLLALRSCHMQFAQSAASAHFDAASAEAPRSSHEPLLPLSRWFKWSLPQPLTRSRATGAEPDAGGVGLLRLSSAGVGGAGLVST